MTIKRFSILAILISSLFCGAQFGGCEGDSPAEQQDDDDDDNNDSESNSDTDVDMDMDIDGDADGDADGDTDTDPESCRFIDIVISVDSSGTMQEELQALRDRVFPLLAESLANISEDMDSFRIGTIDSCPNPANFHTQGNSGACNFEGGNVWIENTSTNMDAEFACVGDIYLDDVQCSGNNDDEQPVSAACTALEEPFLNNQNADFLREDALLVVMAITDEDEQPTGAAQNAQQVYERMVAIKGDVKKEVLLGVGGSRRCDGEYGQADEAVLLKKITDLFIQQERGVFWDLCEGKLEDGLEEAIAIIQDACDDLVVE